MTDSRRMDLDRAEQVLQEVDLSKPISSRRSFMQKFVLASAGAERIAVAFYSNALGVTAATGVAGDAATTSLLNDSHRKYFRSALGQESSHLAVLESVGGTFPYRTSGHPTGLRRLGRSFAPLQHLNRRRRCSRRPRYRSPRLTPCSN